MKDHSKPVLQYVSKRITFDQLRKCINPMSRAVDFYSYSHNGGIARRRDANEIAKAIRDTAMKFGAAYHDFPRATWCGNWKRTVQSEKAERLGLSYVKYYMEYLEKRLTEIVYEL